MDLGSNMTELSSKYFMATETKATFIKRMY